VPINIKLDWLTDVALQIIEKGGIKMTNYKDDCCGGGYRRPRRRPKINQTILACGNGSGLIIPQHNENNSQLFNPYVIASVALDTSDLKKPNIKVDFSCVISFRDNDSDDLRLTFQLVKTTQFGGRIPLGTWNFERDFDDNDQIETVDSFGFTFCECDDCPGCNHYTVELTNVETDDVDFIAITSPTINAIGVGPLAYDYDDDN
jgi:hypothetical protein